MITRPHEAAIRRRRRTPAVCVLALIATSLATTTACAQEYEILAVRYGTIDGFSLRGLLPDAPSGETIDIAMAIWVIRGEGRVVLFDSGFFREQWLERYDFGDFVRPDEALARIGVSPEEVTDVIVSHAHWDHMGGLELFPEATIWIQADEFAYYVGRAWQEGGRSGGIDRDDVAHLVSRNLAGSVRLIDGDDVEILPGITAFVGARHTYASQYILVEGSPRFVLASDNAYLYENIVEGRAGATFSPDDRAANVAAVRRMIELAGDPARVVPGHDARVFERFPALAEGVVRIKP